jgi:hypothetical protein
MTTIPRPDAADVLARAGDHWGWPAFHARSARHGQDPVAECR